MIALMLWLSLTAIRPQSSTPGVIRPLSYETVCSTKWGLDRRMVTVKMKRRVAKDYGVKWSRRSRYEFDHLVPRALGGADDVRNLWPQPKFGRVNAGQKDHLEVTLWRMTCANQISLQDAQHVFLTDWVAGYKKYVVDRRK